MKKEILISVASILFFACGSNAENNIEKDVESVQEIELSIDGKLTEATIFQENLEKKTNQVFLLEEVPEELPDKLTEEEPPIVKPVQLVVEDEKQTVDLEVSIEVVKEVKPADVAILMEDHAAWDALLKKNVSASGKVNYKGIKTSLPVLEEYLKHLKENTPKSTWSKNEKMAYWINLYNASTVYLIATNYPTSSITKLNGGKPWDKKFVKSGDKVYTLNQIENEIVRPRFKDPRIHAALNCAAVSCPSLLNEALVSISLNNQLNKQCRVWVNDASKNKLEDAKIKVSQIFDWYAADFKAGGGVVAFINKYATTKVSTKAKVSYLEYDWALNE